jgi:hypothetical protein
VSGKITLRPYSAADEITTMIVGWLKEHLMR